LCKPIDGWSQSIGDLEALQQNVIGGVTRLGFSDDFLMLVQKYQGQDPELFDSFNLIARLA